MTRERWSGVLQYVRNLAGEPAVEGMSDSTLIQRFAVKDDEAAFVELVRGHGPMVLCVCRRVLPDLADAEDAFQATFCVLAQGDGNRLARFAGWLAAHRGIPHRRSGQGEDGAIRLVRAGGSHDGHNTIGAVRPGAAHGA